jgi:hypothetical protein
MTPTISVNVNVRNPGQVFACMGLFELANCLADKQKQPVAWFQDLSCSQTQFHVTAFNDNGEEISLDDIVSALKTCQVEEMDFNEREGPVKLGPPYDLVVDWRDAYPRNKTAKTWAGQQNMSAIIRDLLCHLPESSGSELLHTSAVTDRAVTYFNATQAMGALSIGFSHNELNLYELSVFPFCEFLCLLGLQRACPQDAGRYSRQYAVWSVPLTLNAAGLAMSTNLPMQKTVNLTFDMFKRSPDGKYKAFAPARQLNQ